MCWLSRRGKKKASSSQLLLDSWHSHAGRRSRKDVRGRVLTAAGPHFRALKSVSPVERAAVNQRRRRHNSSAASSSAADAAAANLRKPASSALFVDSAPALGDDIAGSSAASSSAADAAAAAAANLRKPASSALFVDSAPALGDDIAGRCPRAFISGQSVASLPRQVWGLNKSCALIAFK